MRIDLPRPSRRRLSLTSLIDVIFLLLLFFMLSSTFTRFASVEIAAPGGGGGTAPRPKIFATVDAEGLAINGERFADAEAVRAKIEQLAESGGDTALLVPKEGARAQDLVTALERLRAGDRLKVVVAR
ncbi:ExbD/TolR family protein [Stappia sp. ICDLI1TA098]